MKPDLAEDRPADVAVCPACAAQNGPRQDFCSHCGGPLSSFAVMDPMKTVYSFGWTCRRASSGGTSPLVFWGMWAIFAPAVLIAFGTIIDIVRPHWLLSRGEDWLSIALILGMGALYGAVLWRVTRNYLRQRCAERWQTAGLCGTCGYSLHALTTSRCPECGTAFSANDLGSAADD